MSTNKRKQYTPRKKPGISSGYTFEKEKAILNHWIDQRLSLGEVPRLFDVVEHARRIKLHMPKKLISGMFRLHRAYVMSSRQQRDPKRSRKQPPMLTNTLGCLHGDIGYFPLHTEYSTPKSFRSGFLIFKDICSRYTYVELIKGEKSAPNLVRKLQRILLQHKKQHTDYSIISISFDQEKGIKSKEMINFCKQQNIQLSFYTDTSSKAKIAENAIRLLRTDVEVRRSVKKEVWWQAIHKLVEGQNRKQIVINGKGTGFSPVDINTLTLKKFLNKCKKLLPSLYFAQFRCDPSFIPFKYRIGDQVRTKLLLSSSQVIGNKRSQISIDPKSLFEIKEYVPFVTRDLHLRPGYRCLEVNYGDSQFFAEEDIALVKMAGPNSLEEKEGAEML